MLHVPRLAIVAGTGRKTGKTTIACRIIKTFSHCNITAVKISSHLHDPQDHLVSLHTSDRYLIWEEKSSESGKDSSEFLKAGATRSFYIQALKENSADAFQKLLELLPYSSPIVCESPSLASSVIPGALIIVSGSGVDADTDKNLSALRERKAFRLTTAELDAGAIIPLILDETGFRF
jgi:hypothetical protein